MYHPWSTWMYHQHLTLNPHASSSSMTFLAMHFDHLSQGPTSVNLLPLRWNSDISLSNHKFLFTKIFGQGYPTAKMLNMNVIFSPMLFKFSSPSLWLSLTSVYNLGASLYSFIFNAFPFFSFPAWNLDGILQPGWGFPSAICSLQWTGWTLLEKITCFFS